MGRPWTRELPAAPGIYDHRNLENAGGRASIRERVMFVGYVNWPEDPKRGQGKTPMPLGSGKLRACRLEDPMTTNSLTVQEWGGEWRRMDGLGRMPRGVAAPPAYLSPEACIKFAEAELAKRARGVVAVDPASGWHPIETVPKDGREVILREGSRVGSACWVKWPDTYDSDGSPNREGGEGWTVGFDGDEWRAPDAWQPLPAAGVKGLDDAQG